MGECFSRKCMHFLPFFSRMLSSIVYHYGLTLARSAVLTAVLSGGADSEDVHAVGSNAWDLVPHGVVL